MYTIFYVGKTYSDITTGTILSRHRTMEKAKEVQAKLEKKNARYAYGNTLIREGNYKKGK